MLTASLIAICAVAGALHVLWALRIWWPIADEAELARTVVGGPEMTRMPGRMITWVVSAVIFLGMLWIMLLAGWVQLDLPGWLVQLGGWTMSAILILRALYPYVLFRHLNLNPRFRRLNLIYFSPIILYLGVGSLVLTLG